MSRSRIVPCLLICATAYAAHIPSVGAQAGQPSLPAGTDPELAQALLAVRTCTALGEAKQAPQARAAGVEAEARLTAYLKRQPRSVDAIVALARTLTQCLLPAADFAGQGELSGRALELLEQGLEIDPTHWTARYVLASINFRMPAFLGRAPRAAKELDILLAQQGDRTTNPMFARVFEYRGTLWSRAGQADSARALWTRGTALFPDDTVLARLAAPAKPTTGAAGSPPAALAAVRVVASNRASAANAPLPAIQAVTRSQVLMTAGGGADVLQAVQMQPGATRVTEGSDVYTRGGDASETSLMVNGGRLLSLGRFEGLSGSMFGALEPFVVRSVRYSSGGFSVRHGNALSGVLEIETDGRPRERQFRAGGSLVQVSGTARAPVSKKVGAWVSGRMSHTGALLATHGRSDEFATAPQSQEMIASVVASPTPMTELRATAIVERDDSRRIVDAAGWRGPFHAAGETRAVQLGSHWVSSRAPVVVRANVTGNSRSSAWDFGVMSRDRNERSLLSRVDAEWARSPALTFRMGAEHGALTHDVRGVLPTTPSVAADAPTRVAAAEIVSARHLGGYVETDFTSAAATLTLGLRADRLPGEQETTLDPRAALNVRRGLWTARFSGGLFHQGRFRAAPAIPDAGTPSGAARRASHLVAGIEREGSTTTLRAEAFTKTYGDYAPSGAGPRIASGTAQGLDLIAQRTTGRLTGWVGYSLIDAAVTLADGRKARSPYDVTHSATTSATWALATDWSLGSTVRYGTGAPVTPILGAETDANGRAVPVYGAVTSERLPTYGRLDARLMRFIRMPGFLLSTYVEAMNVTGRRNVASIAYDASYRSPRPVHSFFASRTLVAGGEVQFR